MENEQITTNDVTQTEPVNNPVQENTTDVVKQTLNESPLEEATTDVNLPTGTTEPTEDINAVKDQPEVSEEIQKKLDKLKEYEVKDNELEELKKRLGTQAPQDNVVFNAQREMAIVENQAQQQYIALCNKYGVDYRTDKIDESARELQEKDPKAFYELRYQLEKLTTEVEAKRNQVEQFITTRDISLAIERNRKIIDMSPAVQNVLNMYMQQNNMTGSDIDMLVNSSVEIAREAFEMGRQAALQEQSKNTAPAKVLNNNVITQQTSAPTVENTTLTLADVAKMDINEYAKNAKLIDKLIFEGKIK